MEAYDLVRAGFTASLKGETTSVSFARRALAIDSLYGSAIALLPIAAYNFRLNALADSALERAARQRDRMTPLEQADVDELAAIRDGDLAAFVRATLRQSRAESRQGRV